jgi:uncharacterized protein (DUF1778 family)
MAVKPVDGAYFNPSRHSDLYCKKRYKMLNQPSWRYSMSRAVKRKEHPLSMRLPEADIAIIDRAATLRGRSRTDFVRDAAVRAAEDVLMETVPVRMSPAGFKAFMAALSGPATAVPEIVELFGRKAPWETKPRARSGADSRPHEENASKQKSRSKTRN